jgi:hypothetical protein
MSYMTYINHVSDWIQQISQSALAAAVAMLGLVILLELSSIRRLRHAMDTQLTRVLEQLDLLRSENQRLLEAQGRAPAAAERVATHTLASTPPAANVAAAYHAPVVASGGEARLLAALTAARARLQTPSIVHQKTA